jgi:hypothetical protein
MGFVALCGQLSNPGNHWSRCLERKNYCRPTIRETLFMTIGLLTYSTMPDILIQHARSVYLYIVNISY